jgi:hypothetical protein
VSATATPATKIEGATAQEKAKNLVDKLQEMKLI